MNNMNGKHAELKVQWVQDQRDNWTQVWQYKTKYQDEWHDKASSFEPLWDEDTQYRSKPVVETQTEAQLNLEENSMNTDTKLMLARVMAITAMSKLIVTTDNLDGLTEVMINPQHKHFHTFVQWMADQVKDPSRVWQATRKDGTWMDLDAGQEPRFYESREYRPKPEEAETEFDCVIETTEDPGLPGTEAAAMWQHDRGNVPPTPWQATRKDGSWMDIGINTEPRWFNSRRYRRKPAEAVPLVRRDGVYTYAMMIDADRDIGVCSGEKPAHELLEYCRRENLTIIRGPYTVTVRNGKVIAG
jgi:hypothetical protein